MSTETVSHETWLKARIDLLAREKAFTRERDALSAARRALPRVRVETDYRFATEDGEQTLADLFGPHSQLLVQHFMYGSDWEAGCKSCSFWADGFDRSVAHLAARDVAFVAVSTAPLTTLLAYRDRMGWTFPWISAGANGFNRDFNVTFAPGEPRPGDIYNYAPKTYPAEELPGISVFQKDPDGTVYHTYSTYGRGLDMMNATYHYLDLVPKGRDEDGLPSTMAWLRRRDEYQNGQ